MGRDLSGPFHQNNPGLFQSTRPRGARQLRRVSIRAWLSVSIHAPAWGATAEHQKRAYDKVCFNPRARVGRDQIDEGLRARRVGFQSTRPRGARLKERAEELARRAFQSTRPRGARPRKVRLIDGLNSVSIHAPAWGATVVYSVEVHVVGVSIHAPAWGATTCTYPSLLSPSTFQSTRPRGARQIAG